MNTNAVHFQDVKWSAGLIKDFGPLSHQITRTYAKRCKKRGADFDSSVRRDANAWLRDAHEMLTRAHPMFRQIHSNEDIDDKARWCAKQCEPFLTETQLARKSHRRVEIGLDLVHKVSANNTLRARKKEAYANRVYSRTT